MFYQQNRRPGQPDRQDCDSDQDCAAGDKEAGLNIESLCNGAHDQGNKKSREPVNRGSNVHSDSLLFRRHDARQVIERQREG